MNDRRARLAPIAASRGWQSPSCCRGMLRQHPAYRSMTGLRVSRRDSEGYADLATPNRPVGEPVMPGTNRLQALLLLVLILLNGCSATGNVRMPIPVLLVHAPQPAHRVVVMLPGRGDDLVGLQRRGAAGIIQHAWPDADVILTGLTMPYYTGGVAVRRLHDEVIAPLRRKGYRQIWLAGISLGGLGSLLYDQAYPGQIDGMLLLSPYLGERAIQREIRTAGGLAAWQPGPAQPIGPATFQRELWRYLKNWPREPSRTRTVWVAYGASERFRAAIELACPGLPADHVLMLPGHHDWTLWKPALSRLLDIAAPAAGQARLHTTDDTRGRARNAAAMTPGKI